MKRSRYKICSLMMALSASCFWSTPYAAERRPHDKELKIEHAEIIAPVSSSGMAAGYLVIWNGTKQTKFLSGIKLPSGSNIAIHKTVVVDGIARMRPVDLPYAIHPNSELVMRRGSYHMMFSARGRALVPNEPMELRVEFSDGKTIEVKAIVRPFGTRVAGDDHVKNGS